MQAMILLGVMLFLDRNTDGYNHSYRHVIKSLS
jgi:hypothetical protein